MKIKRSIKITVLLILILLNAAVLNNSQHILSVVASGVALIILFWQLMRVAKPYLLPLDKGEKSQKKTSDTNSDDTSTD